MREETVTQRERRIERDKARKARRRKRGLCNDCPRKATFGRTLCDLCAPKRREQARARSRARGALPREEIPPHDRRKSKAKRRKLGLCNDCAEPAYESRSRCEKCAEIHRRRERLALKYGRPDYLAHLHEDLPLWQRALLARGQAVHLRQQKRA